MPERPSMREILEAARRGSPAPPKDDAAEPPAAPAKPLSTSEKLAAARGLAPKPSEANEEKAVAAPPPAATAEAKELADALRRAGAKKDEEAASRPPVEAPVGIRLPFAPPERPDEPTAVEPPPRSQLHVDHRGVSVFASWRVIGRAVLVVAIVLAAWMMVRFLFPDAPP